MKNIKPAILLFTFVFTFSTNSILKAAYQDSLKSDEAKIDLSKLPQNDTCVNCHLEEEIMPEDFLSDDIHMQAGLSCAGCHGGDNSKTDEEEAMNEEIGFSGVPENDEIPELCGKCHSEIDVMRTYQPRISTDQVDQYYSSVHGKKLKQGDTKVATCISCHSAHKIMSAKDPRSTVHAFNVPATCKTCHGNKIYMADYNIKTNQFSDYVQSVHGIALLEKEDTGSPACNDCHGNHGATPPGISSLSHVCGSCHPQNMEYFNQSKMGQRFALEKKHACEECHGVHLIAKPNDEMVGTSDKAICMECHDKNDDGYVAADSISMLLSQAVTSYGLAVEKQKEVQIIGMDDTEIGYLLKDAHQGIIQARTLVHTFNPEKVKEKTAVSLKNSNDAKFLGIKEIEDYNTRRLGLGIATLFITILVVSLFFKIREIDKENNI